MIAYTCMRIYSVQYSKYVAMKQIKSRLSKRESTLRGTVNFTTNIFPQSYYIV